jgi:hypothetical protein
LWNKQGQISLGLNDPATEGMVLFVVATSPAATEKWLADSTLTGFTAKMEQNPRVNAEAVRRVIERYPHPDYLGQWGKKANVYVMAGEAKLSGVSGIEHGLSIRLRILYPKSRLTDVRLNGHPISPSETDGYITWVARAYRFVQINIPPERSKSEDFFVVTCEYDPGERRTQGVQSGGW